MTGIIDRFNASPYYGLLGLVALHAEGGSSEVLLTFDQKLTQLYGGIHGGAILTLADSAISTAAASTLADEESIATVELSIQFIAAADRRDLIAKGRVIRRGSKLVFGECSIAAGDQEIARAQGICYVAAKSKFDKSA